MSSGYRYEMTAPDQPLVRTETGPPDPDDGHVVVEVAGCGVCHTDLGFLYGGVRPRHPLPLALGHEISGRVVATAPGSESWAGRAVIVPAVMPCGHCPLCLDGWGTICPQQKMPGNDIQGGFASHVVVPADGLCPVPEEIIEQRGPNFLAGLSVIADAVSTPFQSILRSGLGKGDLAIVVGLGGVGGFAAQIANARGATVVGIEVDQARLERMTAHGVALPLDPREHPGRELRKTIRAFAKERGLPGVRWRIFECSGTGPGQETAFGLLTHGAYLGVVGYTLEKLNLRLSNLMAFDAQCQGNWGCLPEHYPAVLQLVLDGHVQMEPFTKRYPMDQVNEVLAATRSHEIDCRPVLIP